MYSGNTSIATIDAPPTLDSILDNLELFSRYFRAFVDEFGSSYLVVEGDYGGRTLLIWVPWPMAAQVLQTLAALEFRGRIVVGLDVSSAHQAPFRRALFWSGAHAALITIKGKGMGCAFSGEGVAVAPIRHTAPTGLDYLEEHAEAWSATPPIEGPSLPGPPQGALGWETGVPTYGVGLLDLEESLRALFVAWDLSEKI